MECNNRAWALLEQDVQSAEEDREFFAEEEGTDWDRAFATLELAYANAVAANRDEAARLVQEASHQGEQLAEKGERDFFLESHERITARIAAL